MKRIFGVFTVLLLFVSFAAFAGGKTEKGPAEPKVYPGNFVQIPGGTFQMGGEDAHVFGEEERQIPWPEVTLDTFYMAVRPITQGEFESVMGTNPSLGKNPDWAVELVSWFQAVEYCNRLSQRDGLSPVYTINGENVTMNRSANGYPLPTEAEWEYACLAPNVQWTSTAHPWGLKGMPSENYEWCWDRYDGAYPSGKFVNPTGSDTGAHRILRAGPLFGCESRGVVARTRAHDAPANGTTAFGFRVVRSSI